MTQAPPEQSTKQRHNRYPMVAFEHYMLADDRPSHSMVVQMRFWFSGNFKKDAFIDAIKQILIRHPIFQMRLHGHAGKKSSDIFWEHDANLCMPFISWGGMDEPISHPSKLTHIDLTSEIGLRLWMRDNSAQNPRPDDARTHMLVQFHHSVCDGVGMLQFIEDLLIHYGQTMAFETPSPRNLDHSLFEQRGNFSLTPLQWRQRRFRDFKRSFKFFAALAQPLAVPKHQKGQKSQIADLFAAERRILPASTLINIRNTARIKNATVNDILIHELFRTLSPWNQRFGKILNKVRIGLATSLRTPSEAAMSAVNIVSMVFLDKSHRQVTKSCLLEDITEETRDIKTNRMGVTLPRVIRFFGRAPLLVKAFLRFPLCSATAVLSNLGNTLSKSPLMAQDGKLRIGNISLDSYELMPPVRPKTSVSFAINYYAGNLSVTIRYDSTRLTAETAKNLLDQYCIRLESLEIATD